jgi:excisionase family DNA binding protein
MTTLTLGQAARLTGLGKTTLARAIKAGRLSASRTETGSYQIDASELARVYPFPAPGTETDATAETVAATSAAVHQATVALEAQIETLRQVGDLLREQLADVKQDRDQWRSQAERLAALTDQRERQQRSWWKRLVTAG